MEQLCAAVQSAPIVDVSVEHAVIEYLYEKQKDVLSRAYEAAYRSELFKETQKKAPRLDASMFVYDRDITLEADVCVVVMEGEQSHFVDADFVDSVIANNYQPTDNVSASIRQIMEEEDAESAPLVTREYFYQNFFTSRTRRIVSCYTAAAESPESNRLLGYEDLAARYIKANDVVDLSSASIIGDRSVCTASILRVPSIKFKSLKVSAIYVEYSNVLVNMRSLRSDYVTRTDPYLSDGAIVGRDLEGNTNTITVASLRDIFTKTKAKKVWATKGVRKSDGDLSAAIIDGVLHGSASDSEEAVAYREFAAALDAIVEAVAVAAKGCDS